jgi:hypothetical protein
MEPWHYQHPAGYIGVYKYVKEPPEWPVASCGAVLLESRMLKNL